MQNTVATHWLYKQLKMKKWVITIWTTVLCRLWGSTWKHDWVLMGLQTRITTTWLTAFWRTGGMSRVRERWTEMTGGGRDSKGQVVTQLSVWEEKSFQLSSQLKVVCAQCICVFAHTSVHMLMCMSVFNVTRLQICRHLWSVVSLFKGKMVGAGAKKRCAGVSWSGGFAH